MLLKVIITRHIFLTQIEIIFSESQLILQNKPLEKTNHTFHIMMKNLCLVTCMFHLLIITSGFGILSKPENRNRNGFLDLYTVFIMDGEIDNLKVHCKSGDDDIGDKSLVVPQYFHWTFRMNIVGTTRFYCDFRWMTGNDTVLKEKTFDVFNMRIMFMCGERFDVNNCYWLVRQDGFYFANDDKPFPDGWQFMFNWD